MLRGILYRTASLTKHEQEDLQRRDGKVAVHFITFSRFYFNAIVTTLRYQSLFSLRKNPKKLYYVVDAISRRIPTLVVTIAGVMWQHTEG